MNYQTILHMFTEVPNLSPFDVNMAIDAGWNHCIPYTGLGVGQVADFTQDAIFSRGPKGVKRTGIFIGGRDIHRAMDMLNAARNAMVPPFEVSVFADPSGAFTTAAAMVACGEKAYRRRTGDSLQAKNVVVFGGTGPVGLTCAMLAAQAGAHAIIVSHESKEKADVAAAFCGERYETVITGAVGSGDAEICALLSEADLVFGAAKAGVQILNDRHLASALSVQVFCDVNAVPPEGIAGLGVMDNGVELASTPAGALGIGALAVGNVKYQTQRALLQQMIDTDKPVYLDFSQALVVARSKV
ncbi:NAD(P)-dependent methylenetetrahydromethanopterin dehydrogenase [Sedimenticola selenatireducens]|uniref:NAD(P)-dependent methylenetetrahydromethanopterin dehydrogenase n=1 Tax=Sedimenticola selenatireducens TaxID=191960 RepID=UPI003F4AA09E